MTIFKRPGKAGLKHLIGHILVGESATAYFSAVAEERKTSKQARKAVHEAQWKASVLDWPVNHPDDVADDEGFRVLGSSQFVSALDGLSASFTGQPLVKD
jgi:hypothetical protein